MCPPCSEWTKSFAAAARPGRSRGDQPSMQKQPECRPKGPIRGNPALQRAAPPGCGHRVQTATALRAPRFSASGHGPGSATPLSDRRHSQPEPMGPRKTVFSSRGCKGPERPRASRRMVTHAPRSHLTLASQGGGPPPRIPHQEGHVGVCTGGQHTQTTAEFRAGRI